MPQKPVPKPKPDAATKIVVFGIDNVKWLPRAAWFPKDQAVPAQAAAKRFALNIAEVTNGVAADLCAKIPAGQIHTPGPNVVPAIREVLYETVVATIRLTGETSTAKAEPLDPAFLKPWDAIKPGQTVLASESLQDGWNAAVVVSRTDDKVTLQWRDYAGYPKFTVPVAAVALLRPSRP